MMKECEVKKLELYNTMLCCNISLYYLKLLISVNKIPYLLSSWSVKIYLAFHSHQKNCHLHLTFYCTPIAKMVNTLQVSVQSFQGIFNVLHTHIRNAHEAKLLWQYRVVCQLDSCRHSFVDGAVTKIDVLYIKFHVRVGDNSMYSEWNWASLK